MSEYNQRVYDAVAAAFTVIDVVPNTDDPSVSSPVVELNSLYGTPSQPYFAPGNRLTIPSDHLMEADRHAAIIGATGRLVRVCIDDDRGRRFIVGTSIDREGGTPATILGIVTDELFRPAQA